MPVVETIGALAAAAQLIVYLGKAIDGVHGTVRDGRYADENVGNLVTELEHTRRFLGSCQGICVSVFGPQSIENPHNAELKAMEDEANMLEKLLRKIQPDGDVKKWKWIQKSSRCRELALNMANSRVRLQQHLTVLQMSALFCVRCRDQS